MHRFIKVSEKSKELKPIKLGKEKIEEQKDK